MKKLPEGPIGPLRRDRPFALRRQRRSLASPPPDPPVDVGQPRNDEWLQLPSLSKKKSQFGTVLKDSDREDRVKTAPRLPRSAFAKFT